MATLEGETLNWADGRRADTWRKSRRSNDQGACCEARLGRGTTYVRDSQHPAGTELGFPVGEWARLLAAVPLPGHQEIGRKSASSRTTPSMPRT
ncbi:DUF397 domain-containing protein [Nocardiopsis sp. HNM0947]|uniref:DUF397 domain-containing protein n=1 Tax=Nocardiopsis coralli TaxID=2772213 RepID=A0ABR9PD53_9ACTN|nr:DUF397 domain-containing protein [Nocardiopsis coralli]MBE3001761.1 DUF397 domain-containing protein [Nocardiopsis coralli]